MFNRITPATGPSSPCRQEGPSLGSEACACSSLLLSWAEAWQPGELEPRGLRAGSNELPDPSP